MVHDTPVLPAGNSAPFRPPAHISNTLESAAAGSSSTPELSSGNRRALRKSCDRCYGQKLRCFSANSGSTLFTKCDRCERAGLHCTYSTRSARSESGTQRRKPRQSRLTEPSGTISPPDTDVNDENVFEWSLRHDHEARRIDGVHVHENFESAGDMEISDGSFPCPGFWQIPRFDDWGLPNDMQPEEFRSGSTLSPPLQTPESEFPSLPISLASTAPLPAPFGIGELNYFPKQQSTESIDDRGRAASTAYSLRTQSEALVSISGGRESIESHLMEHLTGLTRQLELFETGKWAKAPASLAELNSCIAPSSVIFEKKLTARIDPVGEIFQIVRRLLALLKDYKMGMLSDGSLETKPASATDRRSGICTASLSYTTVIMLALNGYVLSVKIMARLFHNLCTCLSQLMDSSSSGKGSTSRPADFPTPIHDSRSTCDSATCDANTNYEYGALSWETCWSNPASHQVPSNLRLGEVNFPSDPLGQPLRSVYGTVAAGIEILKDIEVIVCIPSHMSVDCEDPVPAAPPSVEHANDTPSPQKQDRSRALGTQGGDLATRSRESCYSLSARLIRVLWEEEALRLSTVSSTSASALPQGDFRSTFHHANTSSFSTEVALTIIRRCNREIRGLVMTYIESWMENSGLKSEDTKILLVRTD